MSDGTNSALAVRLLTASDIDACMHLKNAARWSQVPADWRLVMQLNPKGCFAGVQNGRVVGSAVVVEYGAALSWIGMVLVDPEYRRHGFGRQLMEQAVARARSRTRVVMLDASSSGHSLYLKLGFRDVGVVARLTGMARPGPSPTEVTPILTSEMAAIAAMDRVAFGGDRLMLLEALRRRRPEVALLRRRQGRIVAYCLGRDGMDCAQIGPVVAETSEDAEAVVQASLQKLKGAAVQFDVLESRGEFMRWLTDAGFSVQRTFSRMYLGEAPVTCDTTRQFAAAGPEFG